MSSKPEVNPERLVRAAAGLLLGALLLSLPGCGKKRVPPPIPVPADAESVAGSRSIRTSAASGAPLIRLLLRESPGLFRVEGGSRASLLIVRAGADQVLLEDGKGKTIAAGSGFRLLPAAGGLLRLDGRPYRGVFEVFLNPLRRPVVINELGLEEYLKGVVPRELMARSLADLEALKAQAVAARTFALAHLGQYVSRGFDLFSDHRSQTYGGVDSESPLSDRAVRETAGSVVLYRGEPILALYSSTCGGLTEAYDAVFQGPAIPYLRGGVRCPDQGSPFRTWDERIGVARLQPALDRHAGVGRLKKLVATGRSSTGRIVEMRFLGSRGEKLLRGLAIRFALGLRSNWITHLDPRYDASGHIVEIRARGRGWGHGVGFCQMGGVELARRGWGWEKILRHYYPGVDFKRRW